MISWNLQTTYTLLCQAPWCIRHDKLKLTRLCMLHTTQKTSGRFSLQLLIKQLNQGTLGTRVIQTPCLIQDNSSIMQSWWHLHKIWVEIISNKSQTYSKFARSAYWLHGTGIPCSSVHKSILIKEWRRTFMYIAVLGTSVNNSMVSYLLIKDTLQCRPISIYSFSN